MELITFIFICYIVYKFINYNNTKNDEITEQELQNFINTIDSLNKSEPETNIKIKPYNHDETKYQLFLQKKKRYLQSDKWQKIRLKVLKRDHYQCLLCGNGVPQTTLNVHHITYKNIFKENLEDLKLLCEQCHENLHYSLGYPSQNLSILDKDYFWSEYLEQKEHKTKLKQHEMYNLL